MSKEWLEKAKEAAKKAAEEAKHAMNEAKDAASNFTSQSRTNQVDAPDDDDGNEETLEQSWQEECMQRIITVESLIDEIKDIIKRNS